MAFNSTIIDLGNSILKTLNSIKYPSLHVYLVCIFVLFFWLIPDSRLVNSTDFILWNIKDLYSLSQSSCCSQCSLAQGLPSLCASHICIWAAGVLALLMFFPQNPGIPLQNDSAFLICCMSYQMLDNTLPVCCTTILPVLYF